MIFLPDKENNVRGLRDFQFDLMLEFAVWVSFFTAKGAKAAKLGLC
jgi:hypothetical protein